jgi:hypothetical protein
LRDREAQDAANLLRRTLTRRRRSFRLLGVADALIVASATTAVLFVLSSAARWISKPGTVAVSAGAIVFFFAASWAWRRWTFGRTAEAIEIRPGDFDNVIITAVEALGGRSVHPVLERELYAQAAAKLHNSEARWRDGGLTRRVALAVAMAATAALLVARDIGAPNGEGNEIPPALVARAVGNATLRVTITPPDYVRRPPIVLEDAYRVDALEGSVIRLQMPAEGTPVHLIEAGQQPQLFDVHDGIAELALEATTSRVLLIRRVAGSVGDTADRLLQIQVYADARPTVAIERPGRDLLFASADGTVPVQITARDDVRLASLTLHYTKVSGSGEIFEFQEGDIPLSTADGSNATSRQAVGTLALNQLQLEDGDTLVYRAVARDDKPGGEPGVSETFLVEIGKRAEASSSGFALPEDRDRQGLSQQMLIMKTERLEADRAKLGADAVAEQSRLLATEQRRVRAEFLFMTGGEVVDEVEEAEHAHELAEGRLENRGQIELLTAIREMSRAEARLNAVDIRQALVFERAALAALQRAFDRRRYFLRTLPERTRIDPARRLSGDLSTARSSRRSPPPTLDDPTLTALRRALINLSTAIATTSGLGPQLAAEVAALDAQSSVLQQSAFQLSTAKTTAERVAAAQAAQVQVSALLLERLPAAGRLHLRFDPLPGMLAEQLSKGLHP